MVCTNKFVGDYRYGLRRSLHRALCELVSNRNLSYDTHFSMQAPHTMANVREQRPSKIACITRMSGEANVGGKWPVKSEAIVWQTAL